MHHNGDVQLQESGADRPPRLLCGFSCGAQAMLRAKHTAGPAHTYRSQCEYTFSKKLENHTAMVSLYFTYYNFARVHQTLRVTPAMRVPSDCR
jgi:hypothetical protein